jgi:hypothetical protein
VTDLFNIQSTAKIQSPWTHWFFYGPTGSGKTTAAASFPFPLFLVPAAEGSELSLHTMDLPYIKLGRDKHGNVIPIRQHFDAVLAELEQKHAAARKLTAAGKDDEAIEAFPWETIVVESMTHLCAMLQDDISQNGRIKMDQQRWGIMSDYLRTLHTRLRALDCHVVFTALAKVEGDEQTQEGAPDVPGKMSRLLPSACDAIGYCETIDGGPKQPPIYRVHFRQHRVYPARTRFKGVPAHIDGFTFGSVLTHLPK